MIARTIARPGDHSVDLKRVPPKSRPAATAPGSILGSIRRWKRPARTPPSTFLFLPIHLSKSPGPLDPIVTKNPLPGRIEESSKPAPPTMIGGFITAYQYEELLRRAIAPRRRRAVRGVICCRKPKCQHLLRPSFRVFTPPCPACTRDVAQSANDTESCAAQCDCAGASAAYEPLGIRRRASKNPLSPKRFAPY